MFAIIRKNDDVVVCLSSTPFNITDSSVSGGGWQLDEYNSSNITEAEVTDIPSTFVNGAWIYKNNQWSIYNQSAVNSVIQNQEKNKMSEVRNIRNQLLLDSDIHVMVDRWESYTEEKKQEWKTYRQDLRNLPNVEGFPWVDFPSKPE
jgi:hypothetical protein